MNALQVFENQDFGQVRTTAIEGEPWFVAADVCRALDIGNPTMALSRLDEDEKALISIEGLSRGNDTGNVVNEPGLYALVLGSRKPEAKAFKRWITHEVIPTIRKHGMYATPEAVEAMLSDPDVMIQTLQALKEARLKGDVLSKQVDAQKPLVQFAETCLSSDDSLLIRDVAKVLGTGEKRLFQMLRDWGLLYRKEGRNLPYQKYIDRGYFEVTEAPYITDGEVHVALTTRVSVKGQQHIANRLKQESEDVPHGKEVCRST